MRRLFVLLMMAMPAAAATRVTLLHTSDYHSHALPFYTEEGERGGIARAVRYLRAEKRKGALVFSGGDTVNKGAPAWSDKFGCAEWPWLNGIVDAMAFGNHDADYGLEAFQRCRDAIRYPILSANTNGFQRYAVLETKGARIGVFAIAGSDFPQLVKVPGLTFGDPVAAAREAVRTLRETERVDAVVMIGHQDTDGDYALARAVPGIDLIFGTHSHLKRELTRIDGTQTWFISPWQYLGYISRVELTIDRHRVTKVAGRLVPVDSRIREDRGVAKQVAAMQKELERDPQYRELFVPIGNLTQPLSVNALAQRTLEAMKSATKADVAISTHSSFRRPLPAGTLTLELLRGAMPYDNEIVVCAMSGAQLQQLIDEEMFVSGPVSAERNYKVATTDYLAGKEKLSCERSGRKARAELRATLSP
jgi:5'-nucleotidase / UDP-sugar diphosphatase